MKFLNNIYLQSFEILFGTIGFENGTPVYGVNTPKPLINENLLNKLISIVLSPFFYIIITILAFVIGIFIYFKRKNINDKKNS